ncbi:MAG: glycoside hydrolase family 13 protein [Pseudomonadota bacterium]
MRRIVLALLLLAAAPGIFAEQSGGSMGPANGIDRIEPPHWWLGFEHAELQLLVHGTDIGRYRASVDYPGIRITRSVTTDNPNYLFVYLDIANAAAGEFELVFEDGGDTRVASYALEQRSADPERNEGFSAADVIYLITPDRFANGNPDNDSVAGFADLPDRSEPYGRHGGDLAGIEARLDYIEDMGFTAIWLNPVLENAMPEASYHGYAITDFYKVDPRFGSNEEYLELADAARSRGIKLIMDQIENHAGSGHWWLDDLPAADWVNFDNRYVATSHARTTNQDPYASRYDTELHAGGWFAKTMPDLNQRNPLLADYLIQNSLWWIEYLGLGGIRQDTYPYPDKAFMAEWTRRIMAEYPQFNIVGEEWSHNPNVTSYWQAGKDNHDGYVSYLPSVFDFPLQAALSGALAGPEPPWGSVWTPVYETLGMDFLYPDPFGLVIFPDNHDMSRIYTQLGDDIDLYRMAMVFYASMRGIPQFFYGTEILMSHPGTDSHGVIRSDFPGGFEDDRKDAFSGTGLSAREREAQAFVRKLLNWRKSASVVHSGKFMHFAPVEHSYVYFRYDDSDTVMVALNRGKDAITLDTVRFAERLRGFRSARDVLSGDRYSLDEPLELGPRSALLLELVR